MSENIHKNNHGKRRFFFLFLLISIFFAGIVFSGFFYLKSTLAIIDSSIIRYMESIALKIDSQFLKENIFINNLARYMGTLTNEEARNAHTLFNSFLQNDSNLLNIYYVTADSPEQGGYIVKGQDWEIPKEYADWTRREWFQDSLKSDSPIVTAPYKDAITKETCVTIARKVTRNNKVIGALGVDMRLKLFNEILERAVMSEGSSIDIVDMNLAYITNKDPLKIGDSTFFFADNESFLNPGKAGSNEEDTFFERNLIHKEGGEHEGEHEHSDSEHEAGKHSYEHLSPAYAHHYLQRRLRKNTYFASMHLESTDWLLVGRGYLSDFTQFYIVFLFIFGILPAIAIIFTIVVVRSWRTNLRLEALSGEMALLNENLAQKVEERTRDIQDILDNTGQGFLTFSKDFQVQPHYSKGCLDIFGKDITGLKVTELLFPGQPGLAADMEQGLTLFFRKTTKAEVVFDLLEHETRISDKIISINYRETAIGDCLCILTDITTAEELKQKTGLERIRNQRVLRALQHKHFFMEFVHSAEELFSTLALNSNTDSMNEKQAQPILFLIHTLKGNAGFFFFDETQKETHDAENLIKDSLLLSSDFSCDEIAINIKRVFYKELKTISDVMGESWLEDVASISLPTEAYVKIVNYVKNKIPKARQLLLYLEHYRTVSIRSLFAKLPFFAESVAAKTGKTLEPMVITGGEYKIIPDKYYALADSCIHIINNMVDHGIEFGYEREAVQKRPSGKIELHISTSKSSIILEFKDDGRGLNAREIEKKAKELGLDKNSLGPGKSVLNFIFEKGFSTSEDVTQVSGRGVGLAAVKEAVLSLGGSIDVQSRIGRGTTFEIILPLK